MAATHSPIQAAPLRLLSLAEVAELTGTSKTFWRRQIRNRKLRAFRVGDLIRVAESDLGDFIAACAMPAKVPAPMAVPSVIARGGDAT